MHAHVNIVRKLKIMILAFHIVTCWSLIAKNYIYKYKLKEKIPNIIELKYRIKNYYSFEQYIS